MATKSASLFAPELIGPAVKDAFKKLDPRIQYRNPVMFVTLVGSALTALLGVEQIVRAQRVRSRKACSKCRLMRPHWWPPVPIRPLATSVARRASPP